MYNYNYEYSLDYENTFLFGVWETWSQTEKKMVTFPVIKRSYSFVMELFDDIELISASIQREKDKFTFFGSPEAAQSYLDSLPLEQSTKVID